MVTRDVRKRLRAAVRQGLALGVVTLGACGGRSERSIEATGGSGGTESRGGMGSIPTWLTPYSEESIACYGVDDGVCTPCCVEAYCFAPSASRCPTVQEVAPTLQTLAPSRCVGPSGPFAPNPDAPPLVENGPCCYLAGSRNCTYPGEGRPFLVSGEAIVAPLRNRSDWQAKERWLQDLEAEARALPDEIRQRLAAEWSRAAQAEHASVASFARFTLELLAVGAPAELVEAAQRAALDEIRHAELCFSLASAYAGSRLGPGPLRVEPGALGKLDLASVAASTVVEGCVGETLSALEAAEAHGRAQSHAVREVLAIVARDEEEHAALAFRFVGWALRVGGVGVRAAVTAAFQAARAELDTCPTLEANEKPSLANHGRFAENERAQVRKRAVNQVLDPVSRDLLAASVAVTRTSPRRAPTGAPERS